MPAAVVIVDASQPTTSLVPAISSAQEAGLDPIIVIGPDTLAKSLPAGIWLLEDEGAEASPLIGVQAALDLLDRERSADSVIVMDAATVPPDGHLDAMIEQGRTAPVVTTKYRYARALPVLASASVWPAIVALDDVRLFDWIEAHGRQVGEVWIARDRGAALVI